MSLNNNQMLPARVRNMRQMNDVLNAEDIILAEIEQIIDEMYQRASLLHEELVNEAWLESKLAERTGAKVDVTGYAEQLLAEFVLDVSDVKDIDMQDVRKFINKWLPAHLMYKVILLLAYEVESGETIDMVMMKLGYSSFFWRVRTLDGSWLLDGSYDLNVVLKPDAWGLRYDGGTNYIVEDFLHSLGIRMRNVQEEKLVPIMLLGWSSLFWAVRTVDGTWNTDGSILLDAIRKQDRWGSVMAVGETYLTSSHRCGVVTVRDLWLLDGGYKLDGTKVLDALNEKEDL